MSKIKIGSIVKWSESLTDTVCMVLAITTFSNEEGDINKIYLITNCNALLNTTEEYLTLVKE